MHIYFTILEYDLMITVIADKTSKKVAKILSSADFF